MLIGIDASRATGTRRTGTENYSYNLIRELLVLNSAHRFRLYFRSEPAPGLFPGEMQQRPIPFPRLWTHVRLSWEMVRHAPDLLFVPSHVLPLIHPQRSVVTVHDLGYQYYPQAHTLSQNVYLRWSTRYNARSATRILADSEATRQDLARFYGTPADKVAVVYPGRDETLSPVVDPAILAACRARYELAGPYLLYVGTLHPRKNLVRLVQAFGQMAADADPALQLVLAGQKGWLYDDILSEIGRLGLAGRVVLTGYVPDDDLPALLSAALAFVYPSLYEGFGLPVLEAMACGAPVLCSNVSSLPEVAGDAALYIDPLDTGSLAGALAEMTTNEGLRNELVDRGFRQIKDFSWQRCAQETLQVLDEAGNGLD